MARRTAAKLSVDLATVTGSGPRGRVIKADVELAATLGRSQIMVSEPSTLVVDSSEGAASHGVKGEVRRVELSRTQSLIGRRMAESRATVPDFALQAEFDMNSLLELRDQLKALSAEQQPVPSVNDMVIKACVLALRAHPKANGSYREGVLKLYDRINIGFAVSAPDALLVGSSTFRVGVTRALGRR